MLAEMTKYYTLCFCFYKVLLRKQVNVLSNEDTAQVAYKKVYEKSQT